MRKIFATLSIIFLAQMLTAQTPIDTTTAKTIPTIFVEGGNFTMGCTGEQRWCDADEKPLHSVTLSSFRMSVTEITVAQYAAFVTATHYVTHNEERGWGDVYKEKHTWEKAKGVSWKDDIYGNRYPNLYACNYPVMRITYADAVAYCRWVGGRLPTESEWEYAARGGNKSRGYQYAGSNKLDTIAWFIANSHNTLHEVGKKISNELGLYDMTGNVWEWCYDWYDNYPYGNIGNPVGAVIGDARVFRGGCWADYETHCHLSTRFNTSPNDGSCYLGFRVVFTK